MFFLTSHLPSDQFSDNNQDFLSGDVCLNSHHFEEIVEGRLIRIHTENGWLISFFSYKPDADALMNSAEGLKDEKSGIFNKVLQTSHQEKVVHKNLENKKAQIFIFSCKSKQFNEHTKNPNRIYYWF